MADPRFFTPKGPFSLARLAELAVADLAPGADLAKEFTHVAPLETAGPEAVGFLDNRRYVDVFCQSRAGACVVRPAMADKAPAGMELLLAKEPYPAYARIARAFFPSSDPVSEVSPSAVVDSTARLSPDCRVEAGAFIGAGAEIGRRSTIRANAVIDAGVVIGNDCVVGACASLSHCLIGNRVVIYPGARIGQDGFGFATSKDGHLRIPQVGRVVIYDDVEIGANTTIDRGSGPDTVIGRGCMIDNLVQIAHNVQLGEGCIIVAQVGISGSTKLEDHVVAGGQAGLTGHLKIGKGSRIAAQAGVMRDTEPGQNYGGSPAVPAREWHRQTVALARLAAGKGTK